MRHQYLYPDVSYISVGRGVISYDCTGQAAEIDRAGMQAQGTPTTRASAHAVGACGRSACRLSVLVLNREGVGAKRSKYRVSLARPWTCLKSLKRCITKRCFKSSASRCDKRNMLKLRTDIYSIIAWVRLFLFSSGDGAMKRKLLAIPKLVPPSKLLQRYV